MDGMVLKPVNISREQYERFRELYPSHGSWSWFVRTSLEKFLAVHDTTPERLIERGIRELSQLDPNEQ